MNAPSSVVSLVIVSHSALVAEGKSLLPAGVVALECDPPTLPTDGRNLVVKAADAFHTKTTAPNQLWS